MMLVFYDLYIMCVVFWKLLYELFYCIVCCKNNVEIPMIMCLSTKMYRQIARNTPTFSPCKWAYGPCIQSILNMTYWVCVFKRQCNKTYVFTPDNACLCIDEILHPRKQEAGCKSNTLIVIIPGISGVRDSHYVEQLLHDVCIPLQIDAIIFNKRGYGNSVGSLSKPYASYADTDDFHIVVEKYREHYDKIVGIGMSAGGNLLAKYMALPHCMLAGGICVATCFDIKRVIHNLPFYCNYIVTRYLKHFLNIRLKPQHYVLQDIDKSLMPKSYKCIDDYYDVNSACTDLHKIDKPLICINAMDDVILPKMTVKPHSNKNIAFVVTQLGGHLGWAESWTSSWVYRAIYNYVGLF